MSIRTSQTGSYGTPPALPLYRFSAEQYRQLVSEGILSAADDDEWQEGLIVRKGLSGAIPSRPIQSSPNGTCQAEPAIPVRRFTRSEYQRMGQTGILDEDEPVELLEGWIIRKMPRSPAHDATTAVGRKVIGRNLPSGYHCRVQSAITTENGEPEPDLAVARGSEEDYASWHPEPKDLAAVMEVAETSLTKDREYKGTLYAQNQIPVYWIINLPERKVEVYTEPTGPGPKLCYRQRRDFAGGDVLPLTLDGRDVAQIPVQDLLPERKAPKPV